MSRILNMIIKKHIDCPCRQFHNNSCDYTCNLTGEDCSEYPDKFPNKCPLPKVKSGSGQNSAALDKVMNADEWKPHLSALPTGKQQLQAKIAQFTNEVESHVNDGVVVPVMDIIDELRQLSALQ